MKIPLTKGKFATIDAEDFEAISAYKWRYHSTGYARTTIYNVDGIKRKDIYMHRMLLDAPKGKLVDHVNGDRLDNTRSNIRLVNKAQNEWNTGIRKNNTSGHKGVTFSKVSNKWLAQIMCNREYIYIGLFDSKDDAVTAHREKELELFGEYARTITE